MKTFISFMMSFSAGCDGLLFWFMSVADHFLGALLATRLLYDIDVDPNSDDDGIYYMFLKDERTVTLPIEITAVNDPPEIRLVPGGVLRLAEVSFK
jgi:hypothetical protein